MRPYDSILGPLTPGPGQEVVPELEELDLVDELLTEDEIDEVLGSEP